MIFIHSKEDQIKKNDIITMTKKILLLDDEADITYTIKNILEDKEFAVDTFNDPILALNYYKVSFYDLIILDIKMPKWMDLNYIVK